MEQVEKLFKTSVEEMERLLSSKSVVGEPITVEGNTIIPILNVGFGFGAGGGTGKGGKNRGDNDGEGSGGGTGGGGGVKTVAVIIINQEGVRVEPIPGSPSMFEKLGAAIGTALQKRGESSEKE